MQDTFHELKQKMKEMRDWMAKENMFESEDGQLAHLLMLDSYKKVSELYDQVTKGLHVLTADATPMEVLQFLSKLMRDDLFKAPDVKSEEAKKRFGLVHEVTGNLKEKIQRLPGNRDLMEEFDKFTAGLQNLWGVMSDVPQAEPLGPEKYAESLEQPLQRMLVLLGAAPMREDEPLPARITASFRQLFYMIGSDGSIDLERARGPFTKAADAVARLKEQRKAAGFDPASEETSVKTREAMAKLWNHMTGGPVDRSEKPIEVMRQVLELVSKYEGEMKAADEKKKREEQNGKGPAGNKDQGLHQIQEQLQRLLEQMGRQGQGEGQNNGNGYQDNEREENSRKPQGNGQDETMDEIRRLLGELENNRSREDKPDGEERFESRSREERPEPKNNNQEREIDDLLGRIRKMLDNYQDGNGGEGRDQPAPREGYGKSDRERLADDVTGRLNKLRVAIRELMGDHVFGTAPADNRRKREEARKDLDDIIGMMNRDNIQLPATAITEFENAKNDMANLERLAKGEPCEKAFWERWMPKDEKDKWEAAEYAFWGPKQPSPSKHEHKHAEGKEAESSKRK